MVNSTNFIRFNLEKMCFIQFLQTNCKYIQELLEKLLKKKKNQKWPIDQEVENILSRLITLQKELLINPDEKKTEEYKEQILKKTSEPVKQIRRLNQQITFIESLIQKLAPSPVEEITDDEQTFLIRLFLASKLSDPDSMVSTLDKYLKNIGLMWNTIILSLYRYIRVYSDLPNCVVRVFLFQQGIEKEFYKLAYRDYGNSTFDLKEEKKEEFEKHKKELIYGAKIQSIQYRDIFQLMISEIVPEFEKLKLDFLECSSQFEELISGFSSIDDFIFDSDKDLDSLNRLLDSLLAFESKFLSKKENFTIFDREFHKFQKETEYIIQSIFGMDIDSKTSHYGGEYQDSYEYDEPFANIKFLIETTNGVLLEKCQKDCDCQPRTSNWNYSPIIPEHRIVHKPVILTPEIEQQISEIPEKLQKLLE